MAVEAPTAFFRDGLAFPLDESSTSESPFQLWYFEAVAHPPSRASLQVVFFSGHPFYAAPFPFYGLVTGSHEDGIIFQGFHPAQKATVVPAANLGSEGTWFGAGSWTAEERAGKTVYIVKFSGPEAGVLEGEIVLVATAPIHHPSSSGANSTVEEPYIKYPNLVSPGLGWSTILPGALVQATVKVNQSESRFDGTGFHDTNFGTGPIAGLINDWYWGRGVVGPYTFVVYHYIPKGSSEWFTAAHLSKNGAVLYNSWSGDSGALAGRVACTTVGWPKQPSEIEPEKEITLGVDLVIGEERWHFDLTSVVTIVSGRGLPYGRWTAKASGGRIGDNAEHEQGSGTFDWMNFGP